MTNKLLLLLIGFSALLAGCASNFTTMAKRPDGSSIMLVGSEADLMTATSDAIVSQFSSDTVHKLQPPEVGYQWTHWFQMNPGSFKITFTKLTGKTREKVRIIGWGLNIDQAATGIDYDHDMARLVYAVENALSRSEKIRAVRATDVMPATEADIAAARAVAIKQGSGTGFFVSNDGYLITNNHVIDGANRIDVYASNGNIYRAKIVSRDPVNDVALLKVEAQTTPLRIKRTGTLKQGDEVFTLGYPLPNLEGHAVKATFGRINAMSGTDDDIRYIQIDVPIQPGNSGGPLIDDDGSVVGITSATVNQGIVVQNAGAVAQNVNYAIKSEYFITLLRYAKVPLAAGNKVDEAIKNPAQFEPSVAQIVASQQVAP